MSEEQPLFDDTRKALVFAANYRPPVPTPAMTRAMTDGVKKKAKRRRKGASAEEAEEADGRIDTRRKPEKFDALTRTAQAGQILAVVGRMDEHHRVLLLALTLTQGEPCGCKSLCCSGWRQDEWWLAKVLQLCEIVKTSGDVLRQPGRRGLSTAPALRAAVVLDYLRGKQSSLAELAAAGDVTAITAAKHRTWIEEYLKQTEDEAWAEADAMFNAAGITGTFTD